MTSVPHARPEDLLAQAGWMRELARSLLGDPAAADDVVQEAWVAALEHPPLLDRPIEPWLARVVRNFAWKRRRAEARRAAHEPRASTPEPPPGPAATAERLELQRTVLAALEEVPEPFRTAVFERHIQGRTSADLARALDVPEATVRWRLSRGLAELRTRLDTRYGERATWSALLVPIALAPAPPLASAPPAHLSLEPGILAMIGVTKLVLAAVVGVTAVGVVLWRQDARAREERPAAELVTAAAAGELAPTAALETSAPAPAAREVRASTTPSSAPPAMLEPEPEPADAAKSHATLRMRFVDAQGAPWSDVRVTSRESEGETNQSGPDGRLELLASPMGDDGEWPVALQAERTGCATRLLRATATLGRVTDLGDVLLEPGSRLEGRILDERGVAIAEAQVGLAAADVFEELEERLRDDGFLRRQGAPGFDHTLTVPSDAGGGFVLEGVEPGRWRVWAAMSGKGHGWSESFEVRAGEDVFALEVRLPDLLATDRITGVVLDPAGEPLAGAHLMWSYERLIESGSTTKALGEDGRFDLVLRWDVSGSLVASDPQGRYAEAFAWDVAPGTLELELRLGEKRTFEVRVRDPEERPVVGCRFDAELDLGASLTSSDVSPRELEPGLYALALPSIPFQLAVEADGFLPQSFADLRPESVGALFEVVLAPAPRLSGRVLAGGKPVAGARVTLHRAIVGKSYWLDGFPLRYERSTLDEDTTSADGSFELTCQDTGPVWVRAASAGWVAGDVEVVDSKQTGELAIELSEGGSIEGRVLLPDGADAEGIVVGISRGDGHARTLRAGPEGRFRFDHLMPGPWQVLRRESELDPSTSTTARTPQAVEIEWSCTVEAGRVTRHDLDLTR